ncbi:MAG: DUF3791 domain-containing protein [Ruminococcus sp.]|jgi:hypothetical protein|nr:DUF3791 domain-containing protein [Ruminococcus sp.]
MAVNRITHLQTEIAHLYMRRNGLTPAEFIAEDDKYGILRFIASGYEPFHVTGSDSVVEELENFIALKKTAAANN